MICERIVSSAKPNVDGIASRVEEPLRTITVLYQTLRGAEMCAAKDMQKRNPTILHIPPFKIHYTVSPGHCPAKQPLKLQTGLYAYCTRHGLFGIRI